MNVLLQSCHTSPSLSLFLENYLRMVQKLLETNNPDLEVDHLTVVVIQV